MEKGVRFKPQKVDLTCRFTFFKCQVADTHSAPHITKYLWVFLFMVNFFISVVSLFLMYFRGSLLDVLEPDGKMSPLMEDDSPDTFRSRYCCL